MPLFKRNLAIDADMLDLFLVQELLKFVQYTLMVGEHEELGAVFVKGLQELAYTFDFCLSGQPVGNHEATHTS